MVDEEVENTLREIKERVGLTAEFEAEVPLALVSSALNGSHAPGNEPATKTAEITSRIDAHLTTTARAWDRLPPLVSKRSGGLARLELWVKRRFKQATRWYSWEQINFNAAVHHALRDVLDALLDLKQQLEQQRDEMAATTEARAQQQEAWAQQLEARAQRLEVGAQQLEQNQIEIRTLRAKIESQRAATEAYRAQVEEEQQARSLEITTRLADLAQELRERDGQIIEEQRVCFKQLSLEMSETEVLLDRTRRDLESRLDKLDSSHGES